MGKLLILIGFIFIIAGLFIHFTGRIPLPGKLPGDLVFEKNNTRIYIPITSCILFSLILSLVFFLVSKLRH